MKRFRIPVVAASICTLLSLGGAGTVSAAPPALAKSDFPAHTQITYLPTVSNADIDSNWSADQYGNPVFHSQSQDELHRTGGWVEEGVLKNKVIWVIVSNTYEQGTDATDPNHFSGLAYNDFTSTLDMNGWTSASRSPSIFPDTVTGQILNDAVQLPDQGLSAYVIGVQVGNAELEGVTLYVSHKNLSSVAWKSLVRQMRDAVALASSPPQQ